VPRHVSKRAERPLKQIDKSPLLGLFGISSKRANRESRRAYSECLIYKISTVTGKARTFSDFLRNTTKDEKYPVPTPLAEQYENNWEFAS
jgi:hypothetical protein